MLELHYKEMLQGEFNLKRVNLLFAFQVNCPGCFFYGLPLVNQLYLKHNKSIGFLGLSTAFEDFEMNTLENTKLLLEEKTLVGETKKALNEHGWDKYPKEIDFPIAMDHLKEEEEFMTKENILTICKLNPNYSIWPFYEQEAMQKSIKTYLVRNSKIPVTFTLNQFRGTPTFVLFNEQYRILEQWFGHKNPQEINEILNKWL